MPSKTENGEYDVIVVGCGYAGAVAAIEAHDAGAEVLILEKFFEPGGISICSAGGVRIARDSVQAFIYLKRTNRDTTPDNVLQQLAEGMTGLADYVTSLAGVSRAEVAVREAEANYSFPGYKTFGFVYVESVPGFDAASHYPHVRGSPAGACLFKVLEDNIAKRGIQIQVETKVERLVRDASGRVTGVDTGARTIGARRGVVLACGGFEADPEMQRQYFPGGPVENASYLANTGDGIRMAQQAGADLWHMWHFHGSYGFRHTDPSYPYAIRVKRLPDWRPGSDPELPKMSWILLDGNGRRFMNEYEPYMQDTGGRPFSRYDPVTQQYPRIPAFLVVDEDGRRLYPLGKPTFHDRDRGYTWSDDNLAEVELGILKKCENVDELATAIGVDRDVVGETLASWNTACAGGGDKEFSRRPDTMAPICRAPYFVGEVWPLVSNTQGGPVHDEEQRIVTPFGEAIPGLYAAGEMGSAFGHLYMSGGNLAECFIGGRIAGRNAALGR